MDTKQRLVMAAAAALGVSMTGCGGSTDAPADDCAGAGRRDAAVSDAAASGEIGCCGVAGSEMICGSRPSTDGPADGGSQVP